MKPQGIARMGLWPWVGMAFVFAILTVDDLIERRWRMALISLALWLLALLAVKVVNFINGIIAVSVPVKTSELDLGEPVGGPDFVGKPPTKS